MWMEIQEKLTCFSHHRQYLYPSPFPGFLPREAKPWRKGNGGFESTVSKRHLCSCLN